MTTRSLPPRRARARCLAFATLVLALGASGLAQKRKGEGPSPAVRVVVPKDIANAILHWVDEFDRGRVRLTEFVPVDEGSPVDYVRLGVRGGGFQIDEGRKLSNIAVLQRLVAVAERHPAKETAAALLAVAATGFAGDMFDHKVLQVRELGHFALLRMDAPVVWSHVHAVATTEPQVDEDGEEVVPAGLDATADTDRPEFDPKTTAMWRIAAVRLLGMKDRGVFRSSIEKTLEHRDGRVRLAAAEALGFLHRKESLGVISKQLSGEAHPMVVVALVQAVQRILNDHAHEIEGERSGLALRTALGRLGQVDWRSDMAIVQLLHNHPLKEAIPKLIALMRISRGTADPILKIINGNASRFLGAEAHRALRRMTGAFIPDDPEKWQEFWDKEQDKLVVRRVKKPDEGHTVATTVKSGGSFYGIPVLGCEVVFVLDTSGSMKAKVEAATRRTSAGGKVTMRGTRLSVARRQTLRAVQGMPDNTRFSIVTFDGDVQQWNSKPVKAGRTARSIAASILGRLHPHGGTNVFDALVHVLEAKDIGYGEPATSNVDEVFVLSDGMPSAGQLTRPSDILEVVAEINKLRKVRINTVFSGTGAGADFMKKLAEQNGGVFVQM